MLKVFVELDELVMGEEDEEGEREFQWKERARWIKYEEDVELGGEWGKPHVSTLSFHSLLELRWSLISLNIDFKTSLLTARDHLYTRIVSAHNHKPEIALWK